MFDHSQSKLQDQFELTYNSEHYIVKKYLDKYGHEYYRFQGTRMNDFILTQKGKLSEWSIFDGIISELSKALGLLIEQHYH